MTLYPSMCLCSSVHSAIILASLINNKSGSFSCRSSSTSSFFLCQNLAPRFQCRIFTIFCVPFPFIDLMILFLVLLDRWWLQHLYCTVLHWTVLYCTVLHWIVLYCTALNCTVLYCIVLCCTGQHWHRNKYCLEFSCHVIDLPLDKIIFLDLKITGILGNYALFILSSSNWCCYFNSLHAARTESTWASSFQYSPQTQDAVLLPTHTGLSLSLLQTSSNVILCQQTGLVWLWEAIKEKKRLRFGYSLF